MKYMHGIFKFSYVDNAPFSQYVNADFLNTASYGGHKLPIGWFKSALNGI